ncbi:MAG: GH36-type glycosyl hydrolase domain-containing protein [Steroidobacteraceae bacterium]
MAEAHIVPPGMRLASPSGLRAEINANGSLRRLECGGLTLSLYLGNELEGGPANLYLRRRSAAAEWTALLGPRSPTRFAASAAGDRLIGAGEWLGLQYSIALVLAREVSAWFWHVRIRNTTSTAHELDLTMVQDLALAQYWAVRLNEYYVSQYIDHTPLRDSVHGHVVASRQNLAVEGRHPWCLIGSLRAAVSYATDALQFHGLAVRAGQAPAVMTGELPGKRLQHEHSMVAIRDAPLTIEPGSHAAAGFFGLHVADHPEATSVADLSRLNAIRSLPEATAQIEESARGHLPAGLAQETPSALQSAPPQRAATLFSARSLLEALELEPEALRDAFPPPWRHEERDERSALLSFFHGDDRHVVLRAKELSVLRPHGQLLHTGRHLTPDESALTSTIWMRGVFHSMLTQGHVSINRLLSTVHSYLGLFRSHGQRVFVESEGAWQLLDVPSAFEMIPQGGRWIYRHAAGIIEVRSEAHAEPHRLTLAIEVRSGTPARFLIANHLALDGDDGSGPSHPRWWRNGEGVCAAPSPGTELGRRFPDGRFLLAPLPGTRWEQVGGDELLFADGLSRGQPYLCIIAGPTRLAGVDIRGDLIRAAQGVRETVGSTAEASASRSGLAPHLSLRAPPSSPLAPAVARLADIAPWFAHDALIHYLSPRGLEQYSGGGWGTRDVSQGPVELLLALGRTEPIRDVLLRLMRAQNPDGDWPQWFMFFDRERDIRAGDSHGDIVFWPLVVLAQYLDASGDARVLEEWVPFFDRSGPGAGELASVWEHAQRALALIERRVIGGTALAAYGHGDWNDSLQPANPALRERLCSAWTATLHYQALTMLARALRRAGRSEPASRLDASAAAVRSDFRRFLIADGVLAGYALFDEGGAVRYLLHPRDEVTGVRLSSLAMVHAILEDLLTPAEAREHVALIEAHLAGPDGMRLFDRPMPYHGGPERLFQRAESATFFGREIGLMYMHAHLRYAQALAHMGEADRFFRALCQANPIGLRQIVPTATLRQANCYYSSSDAAFEDRYQASAEYDRVARGTIGLDGGWRVYSSGAGIALGLIVRRFLGVAAEADVLRVDPVIPAALDGLLAEIDLAGWPLEVRYRVGRTGCGVRRIELNGTTLPFSTEANPYRAGAALLARAAVIERMGSKNRLEIELG